MHYITAYSDESYGSSLLLTALRSNMSDVITGVTRNSNVEFSLILNGAPDIITQGSSNIYEFIGQTSAPDLADYLTRARELRRNSGNGVVGNIAHVPTASIALGLHQNRGTIIEAFRALQIAILDIGRVYNVHFNLQPTGLQVIDEYGNIGQLDNYTVNGNINPSFSHHTDNRSPYYSGVYSSNPEEHSATASDDIVWGEERFEGDYSDEEISEFPPNTGLEESDLIFENIDDDGNRYAAVDCGRRPFSIQNYNDLSLLHPTESSSGTITQEQQAHYSQQYNLSRQHLARVRIDDGPVLTYILPREGINYTDEPMVVSGGVYADRQCYIVAVYEFDSPEYWSQIRMLMHRNCEHLYMVLPDWA